MRRTCKPSQHKLDVIIGIKFTSDIKTMLGKNKSNVSFEAGAYKIPCKDWEIVYLNETDKDLKTRINIGMPLAEEMIIMFFSNMGEG